ncbi:hypothetical protein M0M57_00480 [Flavobacterium azooxidireducens]|uniref:Uncharacterized protein n=1 Tax=Flavobacterium azooxidireducens TaxID=1871076 RepID=A0ABY4KIV8_9FLAO|nr:hypothetical protein [Flavobacterium azooxidireducens]UPQ79330.1 hypothetical protein M0M57_00480 [Flavobacterium azooxidireducens]
MDNYEDLINGLNSQDREVKNSKIINEFKAFLKLNNSVYNTFAGVKAEIDNILNNPISVDEAEYYHKLFPSFFVHLKNIKADLSFFPEYTFVPEYQKLIDKHYTFIMRDMTLAETETSRNKILQLLEENKQQLPNYLRNLEIERQQLAEIERQKIEKENNKRREEEEKQQRQQQEALKQSLAEKERQRIQQENEKIRVEKERQRIEQENERRKIEEENKKRIEEQQRQQAEQERQRIAELETKRTQQEKERQKIEEEKRKHLEWERDYFNSPKFIDDIFENLRLNFGGLGFDLRGKSELNEIPHTVYYDYQNRIGNHIIYKSELEIAGNKIQVKTNRFIFRVYFEKLNYFRKSILGEKPNLIKDYEITDSYLPFKFNKYDLYDLKYCKNEGKIIFILKNGNKYELLDESIKHGAAPPVEANYAPLFRKFRGS